MFSRFCCEDGHICPSLVFRDFFGSPCGLRDNDLWGLQPHLLAPLGNIALNSADPNTSIFPSHINHLSPFDIINFPKY